jgi:hypothetical protein
VVIKFKDYATALNAATHPNTPKRLKSAKAALWPTSSLLMAITVRNQRTAKGCPKSAEGQADIHFSQKPKGNRTVY